MSDLYMNMPPALGAATFRIAAKLLGGSLNTFPPDFVPPALEDPNYVPVTRGPTLINLGIALLVLTVVVVCTRIATRHYIVGAIGIDDWLIVPAVVFLGGYTAVNIIGVQHGMGKHVYDVPLRNISFVLKTTYIHSLLYILTSFFVKLSILNFYLRLVAAPATIKQQYVVKGMMAIVAAYTIGALISSAFICKPAYAYWHLDLRFGEACPNKGPYKAFVLGLFGFHIATDFVILLLPLPAVFALKTVPWQRKLGLVGLLGAGGLACMASVLRLTAFPKLQEDVDLTWNVVMVIVWGQVEVALAVVCSSVPAIRPLFRNKRDGSSGALGNFVRSFTPGSSWKRSGLTSTLRTDNDTVWGGDQEESRAKDPDLEAQRTRTETVVEEIQEEEKRDDNENRSIDLGLPIQGNVSRKQSNENV